MAQDSVTVITSINPPTDAMVSWSGVSRLLVVPDRKTPDRAYADSGIELLSSDWNSAMPSLPENHYSRKNLGYLRAMELEPRFLIDTDDDTWPASGQLALGDYDGQKAVEIAGDRQPFMNVFGRRLGTSHWPIWPRGLPLDAIHEPVIERPTEASFIDRLGIVQHLIDGDTDVDAIRRLVFGASEVAFPRTGVLEVAQIGSFFPTNSQLTCFFPIAFPLLYLPSTVSFRFTDILRGVVAKRVLDQVGGAYALADPAGYQIRNVHDYFVDFLSELTVFTGVRDAWDALGTLRCADALGGLIAAYDLLIESGLVQPIEGQLVREWAGVVSSASS